MKPVYAIFAALCLIAILIAAIVIPGCSQDELAAFAGNHPNKTVTAATQAAEKGSEAIDKAVNTAIPIVNTGKAVSDGAAAIGIPYAATLSLVLAAVGAGLGKWQERRTGTTPLLTAATQIVQSVESAFPQKSEAQKAALAAVQDSATKNLVTKIKGT